MRTENKKLVAMIAVSSTDETRMSARLPIPCFVARVAGIISEDGITGTPGCMLVKGVVVAAGGVGACWFEFLDLLPNMRGI